MGDEIEPRALSVPSRVRDGLKELLKSDKVTADHVTMALEAVAKVVEARVKAGLMQVETDQKIRSMMAELRVDTARAEQAAEQFERLQAYMDPETRSAVAAEIVRRQLGS